MTESIALAWSYLSDVPLLLMEGVAGCDPKTEEAKVNLAELEALAETLTALELKHRSIFIEICGG